MFNFYAYTFIDSIQEGKKQIVKNFIKNEELSRILNEFVDAQTAYTKSFYDASKTASLSLAKFASTSETLHDFQETILNQVTHLSSWLKPSKKAK